MSDTHTYPRELEPVRGPVPADRVERVIAGMGKEGRASRSLVERGLAPPEVLTGLTLALLSGQPRPAARQASGGPSAVAGGVWVRERFVVHAPLRLSEPISISGASLRRFTKRGRQYSVTASQTHAADGRLLVSNLTTGLERYRKDPELSDREEGLAEADLPRREPDLAAASANPSLPAVRALRPGQVFVGDAIDMSLDRLRDRDGPRPANPIHSDPEAARRAGLDVPIAGGAHVLSFLQELLLQAWGSEALYHGALVDSRWIAPVRAGTRIVPRAEVVGRDRDRVALAFEISCDGAMASAGTVVVPLGAGPAVGSGR